MREVWMIDLGKQNYKKGNDIQMKLHEYQLTHEDCSGYLLFVEHQPVFTLGGDHKTDNFLCSIEEIKSEGIDIENTNRGGSITYHGPGQIVAYLVLNLSHFKKDVRWYVNELEEWVISSLKYYGINGSRKPAYRGVWVDDEKICAIGISIRKWITMHGIALNVNTDLANFIKINPCGITEFGVTSMAKIGCNTERNQVINVLAEKFQRIFQCNLIIKTLEEVDCFANIR